MYKICNYEEIVNWDKFFVVLKSICSMSKNDKVMFLMTVIIFIIIII